MGNRELARKTTREVKGEVNGIGLRIASPRTVAAVFAKGCFSSLLVGDEGAHDSLLSAVAKWQS